MKKNLAFILFMISFYMSSQNWGCMDATACNYARSATESGIVFNEVINTGSNMNIGVIEDSDNNLITCI